MTSDFCQSCGLQPCIETRPWDKFGAQQKIITTSWGNPLNQHVFLVWKGWCHDRKYQSIWSNQNSKFGFLTNQRWRLSYSLHSISLPYLLYFEVAFSFSKAQPAFQKFVTTVSIHLIPTLAQYMKAIIRVFKQVNSCDLSPLYNNRKG